ncbi:MAG: UDP-glucose dehydrogenase family protein [Bdellovibrionota bacterium]
MKVMVFGAGYVGLVQAAGLSSSGNKVSLIDISKERIEALKMGHCPIHEPQLPELLDEGREKKTIEFALVGSAEYQRALKEAEVFFIAVQTPGGEDGYPDLSAFRSVVESISALEGDLSDRIVVNKSTVPVGTGDEVEKMFKSFGKAPVVVSVPEFLKQGSAVVDFLKPERVVIGTDNQMAREKLESLYSPFMRKRDRIIFMSRRSAELVKYACNAFLAVKISFINEVANLSDAVGADVQEVREGMISDSRIGDQFLYPGVGYGGSCFPKDTIGLVTQANRYETPMRITQAAIETNQEQKHWAYRRLIDELDDLKGKSIALWGLSFKPNTDDLREAPSLYFIEDVIKAGGRVRAYDPVAMENSKHWLQRYLDRGNLELVNDPYEVINSCEALVVLTEWIDFRSPDFDLISKKLHQKLIIDGRNLYDSKELKRHQLRHVGVGRKVHSSAQNKILTNLKIVEV